MINNLVKFMIRILIIFMIKILVKLMINNLVKFITNLYLDYWIKKKLKILTLKIIEINSLLKPFMIKSKSYKKNSKIKKKLRIVIQFNYVCKNL